MQNTVIGKIKSNKTSFRTTNYSENIIYIAINGDQKDIIVRFQDCSEQLQSLIKKGQANEVYVEILFENANTEHKVQKQVRLLTHIGRYFINQNNQPSVRYNEDSTLDFSTSTIFYAHEVLMVGVRHNKESEQDEAFLLERINLANPESEVVKKCANSKDPKIYLRYISKYLEELSIKESVDFIIKKYELLTTNKRQGIFIRNLLLEHLNLFVESPQLRQLLDVKNYVLVLRDNLGKIHPSVADKLLDELIDLHKGFVERHLNLLDGIYRLM